MKSSLNVFAVLALCALTNTAFAKGLQTGVYQGTDQNGQACSFVVSDLKQGPVQMKDACDFETDGPGPWCDQLPKIAVRHLQGKGAFVTSAGTVSYVIDDEYSNMNGDLNGVAFAATSQDGSTISANTDGKTMEIYNAFPTAYSKNFTGKEIADALLKRDANVPYSEVWKKFYTDVTCKIEL